MNLQQLYNDIKQELQHTLAKGAEWMPELFQEQIRLEEGKSIEVADAWQVISDFHPTDGWIQTLDKTGLLQDFDLENEKDIVRAAELCNANNQSLHIRPINKGKLICSLYLPEGESHYYTEVKQQVRLRKYKGEAHYRVYWQQKTQNRQPMLSRLISISEEG